MVGRRWGGSVVDGGSPADMGVWMGGWVRISVGEREEREEREEYTLSLHDALPIYRKSVV